MNCNKCTQDLGFVAVGDFIDFGITYPFGNFPADFLYIFEVRYLNQLIRVEQFGFQGGPVNLLNDFNEDVDICIKIKIDPDTNPNPTGRGLDYLTTPDGACCFCFRSVSKVC